MRAVLAVLALALALPAVTGCAELGVVTDGSSISYGRTNRGRLIDGVKLPDHGLGFTTAPTWRLRGNRYGTDELVALIKAVSRRMTTHAKGMRLVVADLSGRHGGAARAFHRSHQTGRDVDLLYYLRDAAGKPVEPAAMHVLDKHGIARDGSGLRFDVERNWALVRELLTAQEAYVQFIFMYRPLVAKLLEHAQKIEEPEYLIARALKALKQPGDSAPHNDHMHVRIYCPATDRMFGCVDIGPQELLAEREAEAQRMVEAIAAAAPRPGLDEVAALVPVATTPEVVPTLERSAADVWRETAARSARSTAASASLSSLLRASRVELSSWR